MSDPKNWRTRRKKEETSRSPFGRGRYQNNSSTEKSSGRNYRADQARSSQETTTSPRRRTGLRATFTKSDHSDAQVAPTQTVSSQTTPDQRTTYDSSATPASRATPASTAPASRTTPASTAPASRATPASTTPASRTTPASTTPASRTTPASTTPASRTTPASTAPTLTQTASHTIPAYSAPTQTASAHRQTSDHWSKSDDRSTRPSYRNKHHQENSRTPNRRNRNGTDRRSYKKKETLQPNLRFRPPMEPVEDFPSLPGSTQSATTSNSTTSPNSDTTPNSTTTLKSTTPTPNSSPAIVPDSLDQPEKPSWSQLLTQEKPTIKVIRSQPAKNQTDISPSPPSPTAQKQVVDWTDRPHSNFRDQVLPDMYQAPQPKPDWLAELPEALEPEPDPILQQWLAENESWDEKYHNYLLAHQSSY